MSRRFIKKSFIKGLILACVVMSVSALAEDKAVITAPSAYAVDGDTLKIDGQTVRLWGIDAPELKQNCKTADDEAWPCGVIAQDILAMLVATADQISCIIHAHDRFGRLLGQCYGGAIKTGIDLQKTLVLGGFAIAEYNAAYKAEQAIARKNRRGIWRGQFTKPKKWREQQ